MGKVPVEASDKCPDCGAGIAYILTADGAGWLHVGPYDAPTNTQHVSTVCPPTIFTS